MDLSEMQTRAAVFMTFSKTTPQKEYDNGQTAFSLPSSIR